MKVTVSIGVHSNIKPLMTMMAFINFIEVDRVATGGLHSSETLMITFEGDERDYDENVYIEELQGAQWTRYYTN